MINHNSADRPLVGPADAAVLLGGVSVRTLEDWRMDGKGPQYIKVGRLVRYPVEGLYEWLAQRTRDGQAA